MIKVPLLIESISTSQSQNGAFALILREIDGKRKLPIVIGSFEAQSIAIALDSEMMTPRPLTHDLLNNILIGFGIDVVEVLIHSYQDNIFYSKLILKKGDDILEMDSRTSDAVAIAIRANVPIYTYSDILNQTSLILSDDPIENEEENENSEELENQLQALMDQIIPHLENEEDDHEDEGNESFEVQDLFSNEDKSSISQPHSPIELDVEFSNEEDDQLFSLTELKSLMKKAISDENYEEAARLRDLIDKKNNPEK